MGGSGAGIGAGAVMGAAVNGVADEADVKGVDDVAWVDDVAVEMQASEGTRVVVNDNLFLPHPLGRFRLRLNMSPDLGVFRLVPGFSDDVIFAAVRGAPTLRGIIFELYGSGNAASRKSNLIEAIREAIARGIIVVATSQCRKGRVDLDTYALGQRLGVVGVIGAGDMTTECAAIKLGWLLGQGLPAETIRKLFTAPLRGEVTPYTPPPPARGGAERALLPYTRAKL
jgi:hypothetical protein